MPMDLKTNDGRGGKAVLKNLLAKYVPEHLIDRPKQGFSVPLAQWLRSDLKFWASDLLSESEINRQGLFNFHNVNKLLQDHLTGKYDNHRQLWTLLMYQTWSKEFGMH
jgi:asparagine synthase (glutamine-hydrolysing)